MDKDFDEGYRARDFPPFAFASTRTFWIRAVGYWPAASFSRDFTMSQIARRATATPYKASISTPVLYVADASHVATTRSRCTSNSADAPVIGIGWVCGRASHTRFTAWRAATSAVRIGSPFSTRPARIARIVAGLSRISPAATARRATSGFLEMSTIFAMARGPRRRRTINVGGQAARKTVSVFTVGLTQG